MLGRLGLLIEAKPAAHSSCEKSSSRCWKLWVHQTLGPDLSGAVEARSWPNPFWLTREVEELDARDVEGLTSGLAVLPTDELRTKDPLHWKLNVLPMLGWEPCAGDVPGRDVRRLPAAKLCQFARCLDAMGGGKR